MKPQQHHKSFAMAALVFGVTQMAHAATVWSFDNFNSPQENGSLSTGTNESASAWKNVSGLTLLSDVTTPGGSNWWDRSSSPITTNPGTVGSTRIRFNSGQITTDNAMQLVTLGATAATIKFDWAADEGNYTTGLYYASAANTVDTPLILLMTLSGNNSGTTNSWNLAESVTITNGVGGINFTNDARFVFKYHSGTNLGNGNDTWFDNVEISYVPEPSAALLGGLGFLVLLRRRR
jgi:hypothetical protein